MINLTPLIVKISGMGIKESSGRGELKYNIFDTL
jgi:hypothetical protein